MRVLFLNPYHGGSHKDFLEGWQAHSRHEIDALTLPARHWKIRMRCGAWTLAELAQEKSAHKYDVVFATDMVDLALWRSATRHRFSTLPHILFFHENQLTYPDPSREDRDTHFGVTNIFSAAVADAAWFNSEFHRHEFLQAAHRLMQSLPSPVPKNVVAKIRGKSTVVYPGIQTCESIERVVSVAKAFRIVWTGRWEQDKGTNELFEALQEFDDVDYELVVLGANLSAPDRQALKQVAGSRLQFAGFASDRGEYLSWLRSGAVIVSTARHEFFGVGVLEAVCAGCFPLLPRRLAYPEVFEVCGSEIFYGNSATELANRLREVQLLWSKGQRPVLSTQQLEQLKTRFSWKNRAKEMDEALEQHALDRPI